MSTEGVNDMAKDTDIQILECLSSTVQDINDNAKEPCAKGYPGPCLGFLCGIDRTGVVSCGVQAVHLRRKHYRYYARWKAAENRSEDSPDQIIVRRRNSRLIRRARGWLNGAVRRAGERSSARCTACRPFGVLLSAFRAVHLLPP